ncbi:DUF5988 family protein [Streptomyces sp. NPDC093992]|uniref:DUF5988 family protein n=1 Tax=Streptomyces sp. NPDC093992 TaxID=3366053 RepID=UPI003833C586
MSEHFGTQMSVPTADRTLDAVLHGGPSSLTPEQRLISVPPGQDTVKIEHCGGYEHFHRDEAGDAQDGGQVDYRWVRRTRIAE